MSVNQEVLASESLGITPIVEQVAEVAVVQRSAVEGSRAADRLFQRQPTMAASGVSQSRWWGARLFQIIQGLIRHPEDFRNWARVERVTWYEGQPFEPVRWDPHQYGYRL